MKTQALKLLKELTEAHGAPGEEGEIRKIFRREIALPCQSDRLGGLFAVKEGSSKNPRIMIASHMDEVGFMVQSITTEGLIRFVTLGGWWGHTLLSQRVYIQTSEGKKILGVITSKPPHFLSPEERKHVLTPDKMYIDVGASSDEEVRDFGIRIGDTIIPDSSFSPMNNPDLLLCKAFDDRAGVALTIQATQELADKEHPNTLYSTATVQEEMGTRGAQTIPHLINPDVAIILEGTPADDLPGSSKDERQGIIQGGVQIRMMDPTFLSNRKLVRFITDIADESKINYQLAVRKSGGTDARQIHLYKHGVPTVVFGVPARYIHTHNGIIHIDDYLSALQLVVAVIQKLDEKTVASFTDFS